MAGYAGAATAEQPAVDQLLKKIDALQRRVEELEARADHGRKPSRRQASGPRSPGGARAIAAAPAAPATPEVGLNTIAGLAPPEPMGAPYEDALRSDLPGLSLRIPGTQSEVRLYGFAKLTGYRDFGPRNQTDAPAPSLIPLGNSAASLQGGDFGMSARFSRLGLDTRTLTDWGTLETRIEGDFGGGAPTSSTATFRLRQAWAELGTDALRVLVGQANSLWNEGMYETLNDATNLNQSFVRQPQLRVTGRLLPGLTGQVSLEAPDTQFTAADGIFTTGSSPFGGLSPAISRMPDLLGRLSYQSDGAELAVRGLLRQLSMRTIGTGFAGYPESVNVAGWGLAADGRLPMRWLSDVFGPDQLIGMAYYGKGIGRYFGGNTSGQDAISDLGLASSGPSVDFDALPTYGYTAAYRRFWTSTLRSNFAYSYAKQDYPDYVLGYYSGSVPALSLNRNIQQAVVNLIWSPFAQLRGDRVDTGWLDVGVEFSHVHREVFGGASAAGGLRSSGTANRVMGAAVGRF